MKRTRSPISVRQLMDRQALHAASLSFTHPVTGERLSFESSPPPDFTEALRLLRREEEQRGGVVPEEVRDGEEPQDRRSLKAQHPLLAPASPDYTQRISGELDGAESGCRRTLAARRAESMAWFEKRDEQNGDDEEEDLPWAPSMWIDGDSLAPPCSSLMDVIDAMLALARVGPGDVLLDLGAGDGRVCCHAVVGFGASAARGIELDAGEAAKFRENIEHFFGQAPGTNQQDRQRDVPVRVHEGDIFEALRLSSVDCSVGEIDSNADADSCSGSLPLAADDRCAALSGVSVVALYLLPEAITTIRPILDRLLEEGSTRVVCNTWELPWRTPSAKSVAGEHETGIFLYE